MSKQESIYVLHEYGAPSHFLGLEYLLKKTNARVVYHEFSISRRILKAIMKLDFDLLKKQVGNFYFLLTLIFAKPQTIVLGIAPYDFRLCLFRILLSKHRCYYHSSWNQWDGKNFPKRTFSNFKFVRDSWRSFLEQDIKGAFIVTKAAATSLCANYRINASLEVVYHSFQSNIFYPTKTPEDVGEKNINCVFVGRLEDQKGIVEILNSAQSLKGKNVHFHFIGNGPLESSIKENSLYGDTVFYHGFINEKTALADFLRKQDIFILPSKRLLAKTGTYTIWEELFGIALVEAMACGLVPITTNHVGPMEIIEDDVSGFLISEEQLAVDISKRIELLLTDRNKLDMMKTSAIDRSLGFSSEEIAHLWNVVLVSNQEEYTISKISN